MNLILSYSEVYAAKLRASGHERLGDAKDADGREVQVFRVREINIPKSFQAGALNASKTPKLAAMLGTLTETEWWDLAESLSKHLEGLDRLSWATEMREAALRWWGFGASVRTRAIHTMFASMNDAQWDELADEVAKASGLPQ